MVDVKQIRLLREFFICRVSLDMMTVQSNTETPWEEKIPKLFWRGRDSRQERLDLIQLGRKNPDLFNVSLTNFFFFRDKENVYGPKEAHISFFKFFDVSSSKVTEENNMERRGHAYCNCMLILNFTLNI